MRLSEIFRLVYLNLYQNKFKVILTSIGIIVGSATIMMVIAIGTGGKEEIAEQFKNLNAGAIDVSYESSSSFSNQFNIASSETDTVVSFSAAGNAEGFSGGFSGGNSSGRGFGSDFSGGNPFGSTMEGGAMEGGMIIPDGGFMFEFGSGQSDGGDDRMNQEDIILQSNDMEDLKVFVPEIADATISYSTNATVEGGIMEDSTYYTVAGVQSNYGDMSNLQMAIGDFLTETDNESKEKVCVLGSTAAKQIFGSAYAAYDEVVYIDDRPYIVAGVLSEMGTVASGINPDTSIFIPYETGIKYITGSSISPTITVISENINQVNQVIANVKTVLADNYPNSEFTVSDAGSKMEAASASNDTLTLLLISMAVIVFIVGGIGIMNVLFVSVKERTNEIGILKALGCSRKDILLEFLLEASCISLIGSVIGILLSLGITPIIETFSVRVELSVSGALLSLMFGVITGSMFGFYPAFKASRLIPVVALNQE